MEKFLVLVKPGSSQEKVIETGDHTLTVYLHAKPHGGEANDALIKILAKHFQVAKTTISITKGSKSQHKIIEIL